MQRKFFFPKQIKRRLQNQIPKLFDAKLVGDPEAECALIIVEGASAIPIARAGIATLKPETRDCCGLYPLTGKLANVRNKLKLGNVDVQNLMKIIGLKFGVHYNDTRSLRYAHLLIMTDQDYDGYHIKGLIAIEKETKLVKQFYSKEEYDMWCKRNRGGRSASDWHIRYYKGLGTNTVKEGKQYFKRQEGHIFPFTWLDEGCGRALQLAFGPELHRWKEEFCKFISRCAE
ncbi:hypothetical protein M0R45_026242 [Rubus argutus]|uniref:DNA topoisomerase (ATP-hydrolyzing) n=1 Tax=Rubus argutus TaxID=59490 RepID=A0AAW1WYB6_RUBAR